MSIAVVLFIIGLLLVIKGGDWFVESAIRIARYSGLPEIFIGATIVSIATTLPEVTVSVTSTISGHTTMAVGNAVGSMICNIALILGTYLLFKPGLVQDNNYNKKALFLFSYSLILYLLALNRVITRIDGVLLTAMLVFYMYSNIRELSSSQNKKKRISGEELYKIDKVKIIILFVIGITAIIIGSNLLIENGIIIASTLGVPEAVISLTLIALGTSLPEFVTVVTSIVKKKPGIGLGNVIGANILNVSLVVGVSSLIADLEIIKSNINFDLPIVMLLTLILVIPTVIKKKTFRWQGIAFLAIYVIYILRTWGSAL